MNISRLISDLGLLRSLLVASTLALVVLAPFADGTTHVHGIKLFSRPRHHRRALPSAANHARRGSRQNEILTTR